MSTQTDNRTEEARADSLHSVVSCRVCQTPTDPENLTHLRIYVAGSEGVDVCITCRQVLTEVLRGMMRTCIAGKNRPGFGTMQRRQSLRPTA